MVTKKLLIVDDEPYNIILFSEMLSTQGYEIISASDGMHAVEMAKSELPDLIILDWNMPHLDGLGALKEIKKINQLIHIPVIMITGIMTSSENLSLAMSEGAVDFIRKPFDKIELLARVKSLLLLADTIAELNENYILIDKKSKFIAAIVESIPHPLVYYALNGTVLGHNQKFTEICCKVTEPLLGSSIYQILDVEHSDIHANADQQVVNSRKNLNYEVVINEIGTWYIFSKSIFYNLSDEPEGIVCVMTNITDFKKEHEEKIENKKRELASSALRLIQSTELNNRMIADLHAISEHTNKAGKDIIRGMISQFGINSGEKVWNEFETRFENVYESFYQKLNALFPDLTPGEKKLCALLRINLSTKDIAAITFQNPQSIDVARYRLRKKMNLSQEDNLVDFLMKIDA